MSVNPPNYCSHFCILALELQVSDLQSAGKLSYFICSLISKKLTTVRLPFLTFLLHLSQQWRVVLSFVPQPCLYGQWSVTLAHLMFYQRQHGVLLVFLLLLGSALFQSQLPSGKKLYWAVTDPHICSASLSLHMLLFFFLHFVFISSWFCCCCCFVFHTDFAVAFSGDSEFIVVFFPFSEVADVCAAVTA